MKVIKGFVTVILLTVLCAALALTLVAGLVRFAVMNPAYFKTFMATDRYCEEMRGWVSEDLDHVALLYGIEEGTLGMLVKNRSIRWYTNKMIDALYDQKSGDTLTLPDYPGDEFAAFARENTGFDEQGVRDFSEDCANAVRDSLAAVNVELIVGRFRSIRDNRLVSDWSLPLFFAGLLLTVILSVLLRLMYLGENKRAGSVVVWGGYFMGVTLVFVPVMQFLLFDYVGRLKITASAFRTTLTGYLDTILYGCFFVLLALEALTILGSLIAVIRASKRK